MIIDMLSHIGKRKGGGFTAEQLIDLMDEAGVDKCMTCSQLEHIDNEYIATMQQKYPDRLLGFAVINPWAMDGEEELERCYRDYKLYGVKLNAVRFGFAVDRHSLVDPYFKLCSQYQKVVVGHAMSDLFSLPAKWEEMARTFPDVVFVLSHIGIPLMVDSALRIARRTPNIYINTAVTFAPVVKRAIEEAGPEKVVLACDAPYGSMTQHIQVVRNATSNEQAQALVLGGNMRKVFSFSA
jgi:predicted TIM-barrel fold metal-dependent hydrolase